MDKIKELEKEFNNIGAQVNAKTLNKLFTIAVNIGRELERNHIVNYEDKFLANKLKDDNKIKLIREEIDKIKYFILGLVKCAVKEHINENGTWHIKKKSYSYSSNTYAFSDDVVEKYNVKFISSDMQNYGGDFQLTFDMHGVLKEVFEQYGVVDNFNVTMSNSSGEEDDYLGVENLDDLYSCSIYGLQCVTDWDIDKVKAFYAAITKPFMFMIISGQICIA